MKTFRRMLSGALAGAALLGIIASPAYATFEAAIKAFNDQNFPVALDLLEKEALAGDARARKLLGDLYSKHPYHENILTEDAIEAFNDDYGTPRLVEAMKWYLLAHVRTYMHEYERVLLTPELYNPHLLAGERVEALRMRLSSQNILEAEEMAEDLLEGGSAADLVRLGDLYERGRGFSRNFPKAALFYNIASDPTSGVTGLGEAARGEAAEKFNQLWARMGAGERQEYQRLRDRWVHPAIIRSPTRTPLDIRRENTIAELRAVQEQLAVERAADLINNVALIQYALNVLGYQAGPEDGVIGEDTRRAIRLFQSSNGFPPSGALRRQEELARLFQRGAARENAYRLQYVLGLMYMQGIGVIPNGREAERWLLRAANRPSNYCLADYALGMLYRDGMPGLIDENGDPAFDATGAPTAIEPNIELARARFARAISFGRFPEPDRRVAGAVETCLRRAQQALTELNE